MFWNFCVGIHRYSALTYDVIKFISHVCKTRKLETAILHGNKGCYVIKKKIYIYQTSLAKDVVKRAFAELNKNFQDEFTN